MALLERDGLLITPEEGGWQDNIFAAPPEAFLSASLAEEEDFEGPVPLLSPPAATAKETEGRRSISAFRLAFIAYFFTSGGPFGIEPGISAAGPLYNLVAFILVPCFWSIPQALMSAELSLMMEQNGGNILWVRRAFGDFMAWMNAYNYLAYSFASLALGYILFVDYLPPSVNENVTEWEGWLLQLGFCLLMTGLNLWGISWISKLSAVFFVLIWMPFIAEAISAPILVETHWERVKDTVPLGEVQWSLFLSTVLWCFGGFDSIGSVAGEVRGGRRTFMLGISCSVPIIMANYIMPVVVGYAIVPLNDQWQSGFFTQIAFKVSTWLGVWMVFSSVVSNFGGCNAGVASLSRVVWACGKGRSRSKIFPGIVSWSIRSKNGTITPIAAILLTALTSFVLSLLPFNVLVQFTMAVRVLNLWFEYAALIYLKWTEPETPRPFAVPGGIIGAVIIALPTVALSCLLLASASWTLWVWTGALNIVAATLFLLRYLWCCVFRPERPPMLLPVN